MSRATFTMSWGETLELTNVSPAATATVIYRVREGDYRVDVVFRSGKSLTTEGVYLASGFDYQDQITVTSSEIQAIHKPVDSR